MIITREKGMRMWGGGSGSTSASGVNGGGGFSLAVTEGEGTGNAYTGFTYESGVLSLIKGTQFVTTDFFNRLFTAYDANGTAIVPNDTTTAINNLKIMVGTWTEQYLSALGMNSQGGGTGGGGVSSIRVSSSSIITPDSDGIADLTNYVSTAADRANWNTAYSQSHTHSNKSVLDGITSAKVTSWDNVAKIMEDDADAIINKWDEIIDFLDGIPDQSSLAEILAAKANTSTTVTNVAYTSKKLQKTINGTTTDIVTASTLFSDGLPTNTTKNYVLAAPSNAAGTPTFRALVGADLPDLSATYATASRATTLEGYFTDGVAKVAAKLNTGTTTYSVWGQTYWSSGVPQSVSGNMTSVGSITPSANGNALGTTSARFNIYGTAGNFSGNVSIGGTLGVTGATTLSSTLSVASGITLTTTKKIYFGDTSHYLELDSTGFHFSHGVYSDLFVSSLGANSSGGGGSGIDLDAMWASLMNTTTDTYASSKIATAHIPNLSASIITSGTLAAARIPIATASAVGGIKVGTTLAISSGVLNQKSGIATAGTYRSVTVDTYGRVTAGTNPTTLSGYGVLDDANSKYYALYGGTKLNNSLSSTNTIDLDDYTTPGNYYCGAIADSDYIYHKPIRGAFRMWVTSSNGVGAHYRQRYQLYNSMIAYERWKLSGNDWTDWYTVQSNLADYLPLSGGTLTSYLDIDRSPYGAISLGAQLNVLRARCMNAGTGTFAYNNVISLFGSGETGTTVNNLGVRLGSQSGATWISAGESGKTLSSQYTDMCNTESVYITADNQIKFFTNCANDGTSFTDAATINSSGDLTVARYVYATTFYGALSGNAATATKATQDGDGRTITSTYLTSIGRSGDYITQTKGGTTSNVTKILERNGTYTHLIGATGWYRIGRFLNTASQSASCILLLSRSYTYKGNESYAFSITLSYSGKISISQLAGYYHSTRLIDKIRVEYVTDNSSFYPAIDIHVNEDTTDNNSYRVTFIGGAQALSEFEKDPTLTGSTFEYTVRTGIGTAVRTTDGNAIVVGNANGAIGLLTSTNIGVYDYNTTTWLIATNGTNTWLSQGNVGIGTDTPSYKLQVGGTLGVTGATTLSSTLSVTGASTLTGNVTTSGHIYVANNKHIYMKNAAATNYSVMYISTSDNLHIGYGTAGASMSTYVNGYSVVLRYGTSRSTGLTLGSDGNITLAGSITGGAFYHSNGSYEYWKDSNGDDIGIHSLSSSNNYWVGYGLCPKGYQLRIGGGSIQFYYGTSRTAGMLFNTSGYLGVGNTNPSYRLHVTGSVYATSEVTAASDERKKNIISNTKFNVKDIASARSVLFEWNDGRDKDNSKKIHGGSIAQDWLGKADSFLNQDNDGWYSINYGALALCSAITIAREVVKHDDEITRLKKEVVKLRERVAELEERRIA